MNASRYFVVYKPANMVSQFISPDNVRLLGDLDFTFPEGTHAVGRLDSHSEGLLILTTNKKVTRLLFEGPKKHERTYLVLVRHVVTEAQLQQLQEGVAIQVAADEWYTSVPQQALLIDKPTWLPPDEYIHREKGPHSWLSITLTEGKYHQVRKMVAAIGHPCKRLIRASIEQLSAEGMEPGSVREMSEKELFRLLNIG